MNPTRIATITAGIGLIGAILALDWSHLLDALAKAPEAIAAWQGFLWFVAAVALGMLAWGAVTKYPTFHLCDTRQHFCADTVAVLVGVTIAMHHDQGLTLSLLAGFGAPYLSRGIWSLFAPPKTPQ